MIEDYKALVEGIECIFKHIPEAGQVEVLAKLEEIGIGLVQYDDWIPATPDPD
jgi:hypothetical protein